MMRSIQPVTCQWVAALLGFVQPASLAVGALAFVPPPKPDEPQTPQHVESDDQNAPKQEEPDEEPPSDQPTTQDSAPGAGQDQQAPPTTAPDVPASAPAISELPPAKAILEAAVEAIGGRKAFAAIESSKTVGQTASPTEAIGRVEILTDKHGRFMVQQTTGAATIAIGFNGETGWIYNPMVGKYQLLDDTQIKQLKEQTQIHRRVLYLTDSFEKVETVERTSFNGDDCYKIRLIAKDAPEDDRQYAYFSAHSNLIRGTEITKPSPVGPQTTIVMYTEWNEVSGIKVAKEMKVVQGGQVLTTTFETVEFNTVAPAVFELPAEVQELALQRSQSAATQPGMIPATQPTSEPATQPQEVTTDPANPED